jgi:hypothetical protein
MTAKMGNAKVAAIRAIITAAAKLASVSSPRV